MPTELTQQNQLTIVGKRRLRHCERSEAIQGPHTLPPWIASAFGLAMTA